MDNTCKRCNKPIIFSEGTTQQYHVMCRIKGANERSLARVHRIRAERKLTVKH